MTATGTEAVSLAQLKDYADNQSAGGGGAVSLLDSAHTITLTTPLTCGSWQISITGLNTQLRVSGLYDEKRLLLKCVTVISPWMSGDSLIVSRSDSSVLSSPSAINGDMTFRLMYANGSSGGAANFILRVSEIEALIRLGTSQVNNGSDIAFDILVLAE